MTEVEIGKLEDLLAEGSPLPWFVHNGAVANHEQGEIATTYQDDEDPEFDCTVRTWLDNDDANAALIVAAVNALPDLIARWRRSSRRPGLL